MILRRDLLKMAAAGLGVFPAAAAAQTSPPPPTAAPAPAAFDPSLVLEKARALAKKPYAAPPSDLPAPLAKLDYEQYVSIRMKAGASLWAGENIGFALEPLPRGFVFTAPMTINIVEGGQVRSLGFDRSSFDFGKLQVPANLPDVGYSGFRILQPAAGGQGFHDVAIFQGASFFRAIARGQNFGVTARALSVRTADPKGEDFPFIREVWIEKPTLAVDALVVHALLDSETVTGAYRFTLRPGDVTLIDTECTLVARAAVDALGLGAMASMSLFGPTGRHPGDDVREAVSETAGLQILNDNGEWLWRPVTNRDTLQISSFMNTNPRGFGMLQRNRSFDAFQDDVQHWELRPSLWIEPLSDWGEGSVVLVEIPSDSEVNDNIIAFWRPKVPLAANAEASYSYRQSWCWTPPVRPANAVVTDTRDGRGSAGHRRRFLVEFTADAFADPARMASLTATPSASVGTISAVRTFANPQNKTYRVSFELDPGSEALAELRLVLEQGGKAVSETWLYRWTS